MFLRLYPSEKYLYIPVEARHVERIRNKFDRLRLAANENSTKMALSQKSLAGPGYIILNIIRAMNIIGLLAVTAACLVMLVKTHVDSRFFFFDATSHVLMLISSLFLFVSELTLFPNYFARNWPLLSPTHGFVTLAIAFITLGVNILGDLNKQSESRKTLGLPFWRVVIGSGCLIFILGWLNLITSYVFRDRKNNITARQVRAHGAVAIHMTPKANSDFGRTPTAPQLAQSYISNPNPITPTKSSNAFRIFTGTARQSTLPSYHTTHNSPASPPYTVTADPMSPSSKYSRATNCTKKKVFGFMGLNRQSVGPPLPVNPQPPMQISGPIGINPQFAHLVQRPDSALHPSRTGESETSRWKPM